MRMHRTFNLEVKELQQTKTTSGSTSVNQEHQSDVIMGSKLDRFNLGGKKSLAQDTFSCPVWVSLCPRQPQTPAG